MEERTLGRAGPHSQKTFPLVSSLSVSEWRRRESNPRRIPLGPSAALDERHAAADRNPGFVAGQQAVCVEIVDGCEDESIRKPQASGLAAELRCRPRDLRGHRRDSDGEVGKERFDFGHCLGPSAIRRDEDLRIYRQRDEQLVVLVLRESLHSGVVKRIVGVQKRNDDRCVEND